MSKTELLRALFRTPKDHDLRSGDGVMNITSGEEIWHYHEKDAAGKLVASYFVVETDDFKGSGSITWTRTEKDA